MKNTALLAFIAFTSIFTFGEDLCDEYDRPQEAQMLIPESEFNYENALSEVTALKARLSDIPKFEQSWVPLTYSEGYLLKKVALNELAKNSIIAEYAVEDFCTFLVEDGIYYDP
ncbi:hypothetical protein [Zhongshania sp.]|uniref:hypothetical protein n=1 Tax=Zhongshania sp. TaxID=1971902 RepID=UPI0035629012